LGSCLILQRLFDAGDVGWVVQLPEHAPAAIDLDTGDGLPVFEKAQLFEPFELFQPPGGPAGIGA
jgi:hypothetical protein